MKRLLQEPLLHFLLLGAAIFGSYGLMSRRVAAEPGKIVVTRGRVEALATAFQRAWQRPPAAIELDGLIRDYVREEVATREATALGLDKDDVVIRRRLRQKLEFVSEDAAAQAEPTDDQLRAYLDGHPEAFRVERRFTFSQVFLGPERHGERLSRHADRLLMRLRQAGVEADTLSDSRLLDPRFDAVTESAVAKQFGGQFATKLAVAPIGQWSGPIESGYGVHLVFVSQRTEPRQPALEEVRDAVRREWANDRRLEETEQFYRTLLAHYSVTIEQWLPNEGNKNLALVPR